jgi:hypothetical protein
MIRSLRTVLACAPGAATAVSILLAAQLSLSAQTPGTHQVRDFLRDTFSPLSLVRSAASAGIGQWRDSPRQWKQGGEGYGRRYASSYAQHIVAATLMFGSSSVLHENNRYVPSGQSSVGSRVRYALKSTFQARREDGARRISISRIGALAGASLISRLWQPQGTDRFRTAGVNFGTSIGAAMGFEVAREFWPHK